MAIDRRLIAGAHARAALEETDIRDALNAAEMALRRLLLDANA